ncbi:hypothetical protein GALL_427370 [mine drainage metagenome]|uniref:Uncharacterized protein n=1 Tax=mine drainage metagenome TaxID=410659 RepID=A0A1J5Q6G4_9ZZZZ
MLTRKPQAEVVLRQQNFRDARKSCRFMALHPQQLGRSKAWEHDVSGHATKDRIAVKFGGFFVRARVIPQDAGPQNLISCIKHGRAVHLARKAKRAHLG